jgi:hypothetical protein
MAPKDIAKDVSFKLVFGFFLILDILIIRSNSLKRFRNILQSSKKSPYQWNDEITKISEHDFLEKLFYCIKMIFS